MVKQHFVAPFAITSQTQHSRPNNETYAGDLFVTSGQSAGLRIGLSLPDTAAELQAWSRPLLSAQTATRSPPPEVAAAGLQRA